MALFEKTCACCGKSANVLTRTTLTDGKTLCSKCLSAVPSYLHEGIKGSTLDAYQEIRKYLAYANQTIKPRFKQTHKYLGLSLDANSGYLCVNSLASHFAMEPLYLQVEDIVDLDLLYDPETYKDGFFAESVNGDVNIALETCYPGLEFQAVLKKNVKADAHKRAGLFKDKVKYQNPNGQDAFMDQFFATRLNFLNSRAGGRYAG